MRASVPPALTVDVDIGSSPLLSPAQTSREHPAVTPDTKTPSVDWSSWRTEGTPQVGGVAATMLRLTLYTVFAALPAYMSTSRFASSGALAAASKCNASRLIPGSTKVGVIVTPDGRPEPTSAQNRSRAPLRYGTVAVKVAP